MFTGFDAAKLISQLGPDQIYQQTLHMLQNDQAPYDYLANTNNNRIDHL